MCVRACTKGVKTSSLPLTHTTTKTLPNCMQKPIFLCLPSAQTKQNQTKRKETANKLKSFHVFFHRVYLFRRDLTFRRRLRHFDVSI